MEANVVADRRRFRRFTIILAARYRIENGSDSICRCTIINMNQKGIGIRFHTHETMDVGSQIQLEIYVYEKLKFTNVKGILKWNRKRGNGYSLGVDGGVECDELLDEMQFSKSVQSYPPGYWMV
jgi:hypothetical protein